MESYGSFRTLSSAFLLENRYYGCPPSLWALEGRVPKLASESFAAGPQSDTSPRPQGLASAARLYSACASNIHHTNADRCCFSVRQTQQRRAALSIWNLGFMGLNEKQFIHQTVNHMNEYVRGSVQTNGIENFWTLFKRSRVHERLGTASLLV
jgi:hypothetical protein